MFDIVVAIVFFSAAFNLWTGLIVLFTMTAYLGRLAAQLRYGSVWAINLFPAIGPTSVHNNNATAFHVSTNNIVSNHTSK